MKFVCRLNETEFLVRKDISLKIACCHHTHIHTLHNKWQGLHFSRKIKYISLTLYQRTQTTTKAALKTACKRKAFI